MIRFLQISLLSFFLVSCKSYQVENAVAKELFVKEYKNLYFSDSKTDYVYKATIEVYGNQLSGIFIAKRISDITHRVVFTTDFGNTLLDFELSENDFKVNYIQEDLNRKIIINTLRDDFRLLLKENHTVQEIFENDENIIYKSADKKGFNYFFESKVDKKLTKIINASKSKEKIILGFESKSTIFAQSITIQHKNIKLKITLNQITN
ncbi:hypothetical protein J2X31_000072 [Flavobacterium arsenatis]|uniref:Lipoprotein n=1 Tax=Flavobacterium arsenatis TaxID=1484332 RepID=A0ABU1TJA9_9FLAO|nr:hypothetical protein [Flavobacterium arsenatis]MDR6966079.1 hypothetical protein [Flavobacterium arsenatis]